MRDLISYPRQKVSSTAIKILVEGNSISAGVGASSSGAYWPALMNNLPPLIAKGITVQNHAVGGKAISSVGGNSNNLTASGPASIDANLSATAHNILFVNEFINELRLNGINASPAFDAFVNYCLARKLAAANANKKLSIIVCTTTPAGAAPAGEGQSWVDARMAAISQCNLWMRLRYREFADIICDVAMYEPFRAMWSANIWTPAAFNAAGVYHRSDGTADDYTHFGDSGFAILAQAGALSVTRVRTKI